jgi:hypothetical protein
MQRRRSQRRVRLISAAVAVAIPLGTAVCAAVAVPSAQAQTIAVSLHVTKSAVTKPAVTKPVVGVNLYVKDNYSLKDTTAWGERDLTFIRDNLGLKAVAIDWDYNVPSYGSDVVESSPTRTPTIADLRELTNIAHSFGMRVEYRALFAIDNSDSRDRSLSPKHLGPWLSSLLKTETPALELAQSEHVHEFVVGTEMASVDRSPLWTPFFNAAAKIYKGSLSYASWGGRSDADSGGFFDKHRVDLPTADLAATAYPPIALSRYASVAALTKAWEHWLTAYTPAAVLRRTAIDEIGIPALAGSYYDPWQWDNLAGTADPTVQARWFKAVCNAVTAEHMRGIYFWSEPLNDNPAKPFNSLVGFLGRPESLAAIRSC